MSVRSLIMRQNRFEVGYMLPKNEKGKNVWFLFFGVVFVYPCDFKSIEWREGWKDMRLFAFFFPFRPKLNHLQDILGRLNICIRLESNKTNQTKEFYTAFNFNHEFACRIRRFLCLFVLPKPRKRISLSLFLSVSLCLFFLSFEALSFPEARPPSQHGKIAGTVT